MLYRCQIFTICSCSLTLQCPFPLFSQDVCPLVVPRSLNEATTAPSQFKDNDQSVDTDSLFSSISGNSKLILISSACLVNIFVYLQLPQGILDRAPQVPLQTVLLLLVHPDHLPYSFRHLRWFISQQPYPSPLRHLHGFHPYRPPRPARQPPSKVSRTKKSKAS